MGNKIKKIYIMTDLEGVAGILDFENWCEPSGRYYETAKEFLTLEVNAAVRGFFEGKAEEILVSDGHGHGGINQKILDPRVKLLRGWSNGWPFELDKSYDAVAWIGQHAKAGSKRAHIAHTQSFRYKELKVNGVSIGEFGQFAMCASELKVRSIFGAGDEAFAREARKLVTGIETVSVKQGLRKDGGEKLPYKGYAKYNLGAIHLSPERASELIYKGALNSINRANKEKFGIIKLKPPFKCISILRSDESTPEIISKKIHNSSFIALMNMF